jgi:hypothetical protein
MEIEAGRVMPRPGSLAHGGSNVCDDRLEGKAPPKLVLAGKIEVADGPESLEIDVPRRRAYANTWHDVTVAIDLPSRAIVSRWNNGCQGARGLAVDETRGLAFVGCTEGAAVTWTWSTAASRSAARRRGRAWT